LAVEAFLEEINKNRMQEATPTPPTS